MKLLLLIFIIVWAVLGRLARASRKRAEEGKVRAGAPEPEAARRRAEAAAQAARQVEDRDRARDWRLPAVAAPAITAPAPAPKVQVAAAPAMSQTGVAAPQVRMASFKMAAPEPEVERTDWAALLRQRGTLKQAIIVSEILRRPAA